MVSKATLKQYNLNSLSEFFNSIYENEINGNRSDVRKMINLMSRDQKRAFFHSLYTKEGDEDAKEIIKILFEQI